MPPAKKRRLAVQEQPEEDQDKHILFTQWAKDRGVVIGSVKPSVIPGRGVGLVTTAKIKKGEQIIFVPEKAMFKPDPSISQIVKKTKSDIDKPSPQAHLAVSMMVACFKKDSDYETWQKTWPTQEDFESSMPLFWSDEMCEFLPESVKQPLGRMREDYERDLKFCKRSLSTLMRGLEQDFKYFWAIVNSRSFHFKPPGAKPGFMVLCPFVDYMNHGPTGTGVKVSQTPKGYEVVADRDYGKWSLPPFFASRDA